MLQGPYNLWFPRLTLPPDLSTLLVRLAIQVGHLPQSALWLSKQPQKCCYCKDTIATGLNDCRPAVDPRYFADKENTEELITAVLLEEQKKTLQSKAASDLLISTNVFVFFRLTVC